MKTTKEILGQVVEFEENQKGIWAYRIVSLGGRWGEQSAFSMLSLAQAIGRVKKYLELYYTSKSND